jgi:hypothetical protein
VAKLKNSPRHTLQTEALDLEAPEDQEDWEAYLQRAPKEQKLADDLYLRLLNGARNERSRKKIASSLNLKRVAELLAWMSFSNSASLAAGVPIRLEVLGIERHTTKRGRPKGAKTQYLYVQYVQQASHDIERSGVFAIRRSFKKRYRADWSERFRKRLENSQLSLDEVSWLLVSTKPLTFAIRKAGNYFGVSYAAIDRAWRRVAKSTNKQP